MQNQIICSCIVYQRHREEEVATSVIDGPNSYIFEQAENRLHAQKAVLASILA